MEAGERGQVRERRKRDWGSRRSQQKSLHKNEVSRLFGEAEKKNAKIKQENK